MLKKEFRRSDVERARNLIAGKANQSSETQIGYKKKRIKYKEGDVWTENKKTWTIKNGIKQTISKLDAIKKEIFMPLCCPECGRVMKAQKDKPNYRIHKKCLHCVVEFEHKLHCKGEYEDYIKELKAKNSLDMIDEMESYLLNAVNHSNEEYISEQGEVERWVGGIDKEKMTKDIIEAAHIRRESIKKELKSEKVRKNN
jgi:hypothetical protein